MDQFLTLLNSNNYIVDGIFIAIFILFAIIGFKRGFYKSIAPIVIAVFSISGAVFGTNLLEDKAYSIIYPVFSSELNRRIDIALDNAANSSGILHSLIEKVDITAGTDKIAEAIAKDLVHAIFLVVLFLVGLLIFTIISKILERIVSISLVTTFDGILGSIYWLLICFCLMFIIIHGAGLLKIDFFTKASSTSRILQWILSL